MFLIVCLLKVKFDYIINFKMDGVYLFIYFVSSEVSKSGFDQANVIR